MNKLCETAIKNRREYDYAIDDHMWNMKIVSLSDAINPPSLEERVMERLLGQDDDSDDDDGDENQYRGNITIQCPGEEMRGGGADLDDHDAQVLRSSTKLDKSLLPEGFVIKVTYDYGTTTTLYLKVLSVKSQAVRSLVQYFTFEADSTKMMEDLKAVPAYQLPVDKQVDSYFPYASKAFLGFYVPVFTGVEPNGGYDIGENERVMGSLTFGLSSKIRSEEDTVFVSMEDRTSSSDVLFCPSKIEPTELLQVVDKAWKPRDRNADTDGLGSTRFDFISRWVVAADNDVAYERISGMIEDETPYGPKTLLFRLAKNRKQSAFQFEKVFPKTYAQLQCDKFRWIQYKKGVLRVVVGRGVGKDSRQFEGKQVLRTWRYDFKSFHEMLCAVEASWKWEGRELTADTVIPEFDTDLGPSNPLPKEPPCLGKQEDAIVISKCNNRKKLVTALAITEESDGKSVLYSGHDDGTLTKWSLDSNEEIWNKRIYADGTADFERYVGSSGIHVRDTPGVAGIVVRSNPASKSKQSIVYTWTDQYDGFPESEFGKRGPSRLKAWSATTGMYMHEFICDVGDDDEGIKAYPSIATVICCKVSHFGTMVDSIIVGLHCNCNTLDYDKSYSQFDLEEAQEFSVGNIVPFLEHSRGREMPSWRGQGGIIRAMAVVGTKYLVSFSIHEGRGNPDSMVLWSLEEPGVPLFREDFCDPYQRNVFKQQLCRLDEVCGISVKGNELLLVDSFGDRVVAIAVEKEGSRSILKLHGYANIGSKYHEDDGFHGRMSMSLSKHAVVAMENNPTAWIFAIEGCCSNSLLDRRDGNPRDYDHGYRDEEDSESLKRQRAAREIAVGKVEFPLWGGNQPTRKKKKLDHLGPISNFLDYDDDSSGLGNGGPIQVAIRGRHVIAGFSNGTLAKFLLPEQFEENKTQSTNHVTSCSSLPSDEWHAPVLECEDN